ncbi:MAG: cryptochrome/photolyase family protein, partial [Rhodocyclaceae bacterium]|nr:cryptochrome/photolyase family protein [Rhodocyclaceae bacterium]
MSPQSLRHLVIILGDQLDADALALTDFDPTRDALWMAEVAEESTHIPSSKQRTALFLSAMRHFAKAQRALGRLLHYTLLDDTANTGTLAGELTRTLAHTRPEKLVMNAPGDWRVLKAIQAVAREHNIPLDLKDDTHFITTVREFAAHAKGRKQL